MKELNSKVILVVLVCIFVTSCSIYRQLNDVHDTLGLILNKNEPEKKVKDDKLDYTNKCIKLLHMQQQMIMMGLDHHSLDEQVKVECK